MTARHLADAEATREMGTLLARHVVGGDCIALIGDLGAGKTTLVSGLVEALGGDPSASPTFSIINEYRGGSLIVWHVDLYRIEREAELCELGLEELIGDRRGIVVIEWADKFDVLPPGHLRIVLEHAESGRTMTASGAGRGDVLATAMLRTSG